ncbi:MAG: DNA translocase FtsK [Dehalococcoidia bacterium]|nr:DNA translocase FtsK [Dehalococcoidia bacterium]
MAARARTRGRTARPRKSKRSSWWKPNGALFRAEVVGIAIVAFTIALIPFVVDVSVVFSEARDWIVRTFGMGLFIVAGLSIAGGAAISRRAHERDVYNVARRTIGILAGSLFAWGALGLNEADWSLGNVSFREVSLGGTIGQALVAGALGKLAWLSLAVISASFLAPGPSRWFLSNLPGWTRTAIERRYAQRAAAAVASAAVATGRFVGFAFRRPGPVEPDVIIGASDGQPIVGNASPSFETTQVVYRPSIDPASPSSAVGSGAAAKFRHDGELEEEVFTGADEDLDDMPVVDLDEEDDGEETPEGPTQLGLDLNRRGWQLPPVELLNAPAESEDRKHDNAARAQLIVDTLASFGVDATVVEINEGPTVTQFGVEPGWEVRYKEVPLKGENGRNLVGTDSKVKTERVETGRTRVRVNRITALQNDLALALAAPSLRIEAPVPGRAIVGIEVPNNSATVVTMRTVMETREFRALSGKSKLALALGKGVSGVPAVADLAKMPHLLIAGATGSGKSVCMNSIISGIMMNATPDEVRFIMIDPKRVELSSFARIPHMAFSEVIVDMDKVVGTLQAVVGEMEARYKKFAEVGVRNLEGYNRHARVVKKLPYWVVIIDELADLMMAAPFEVEKLLCRLAQLARATGIHLVVATQRPSVDVITGLIKANFPTRIAFAVTSMTDSRTILDGGGAEKLLGRGDMLFMPTDAAKPIRIQGVYMSDPEVERLVEWWTDERFKALAPENSDELLRAALIERNGGDEDIEVADDDPVLDEARQLASRRNRVSPSLLQRRLNVGYAKAEHLIARLEDEGIVGPREDGESRRVLVATASDPDSGGL